MADPADRFVHLHLHTDHSLLDGCARVDRLAARAAQLGQPAMAMTDHGNLFGAIAFYQACEKAGIKPIIGCEIYLVHDHKMDERPKRERKRTDDIGDVLDEDDAGTPRQLGPEDFPRFQIHHKTLLAKNFKGYQNLVKLVSKGHVEGQYYRPRVDMDAVAAHAEGIIGLSGCINGVAAQHLLYNNFEKAREVTGQFVDIFGRENYFIEVHDHGMPFQRRILPDLVKLAREYDLKVVAANDVHYVHKGDWEPHDALLCIQTGKKVIDEDRMRYPCQEFYLKSREEMAERLGELPEALDNTVEVAEMVDLKIEFGVDHYPVFEQPIELTYNRDEANFDRILDLYENKKNEILVRDGKEPISLSDEERAGFKKNGLYLFDLCKAGLKDRYGVDYDNLSASTLPEDKDEAFPRQVRDQLDYELAIIIGAGFVDYFLITWDFIDWARRQGIPVGPGRGSGAGCMVAYVMRITDIDPLGHGLLFERMLSLERVSPPDFDVDFCMRRRDEVVNYVRDKYGHDRVANIITFGTFGAKMIVRDLARVHDVPYAEADRIAKMVPDDLNISLAAAVEKSSELNNEVKSNPETAKIVQEGLVIEGMIRNTGKHACGIIIGDQPLTNLVPVTLQEGDLTTQYPKGPVEYLGLLKADFLGLRTLTILSDAEANVRRTRNLPDFDVEQVDLNDEATYALLNSGRTTGVFQLESGGMQSLCRRIGLSTFEEIIALIALYRPGPMQFIDAYIEGKKDPSKIQMPHPLLEDIVKETYGILVYQEQVMQAAQIIAGYTLGGADILRRAMGKKIKEMMDEQRNVFVEGAKSTNNIDAKTARDIFAVLEKFAQYGFNKSHSAAYAMLSYRTAFLKANYPVEFMAAVLTSEQGNADKTAHFLEECRAMDVPLLGPHINESRETFTPVVAEQGRGSIRFGMAAIKGVGESAARSIIEEREAHGPFADFRDFATRMDGKQANKRVMENLIKTGAFEELGEDRGDLLANLDGLLKEVAELQRDAASGQANMFDDLFGAMDAGPSNNSTNGHAAASNGRPRVTMPLGKKLQFEKELLGFYLSGHPMNEYAGLAAGLDSFHNDDHTHFPDRSPFRLCAVVTGIDKKISRRDKRPWAILTLATRFNTYSANMYAEAWDSHGDSVELGACVAVTGSIQQRVGETVLTVEKVQPLAPLVPELVESVTFLLNPQEPETAQHFLEDLAGQLQGGGGKTTVKVGFVFEQAVAVADAASSLTCTIDPQAFRDLMKHPAVINLLVEAPAPEAAGPAWKRF